MIAFAVGTLIGDIFLHMFPCFDELNNSGSKNYFYIIVGLISFYFCDYLIAILTNFGNHSHNHSHGANKGKEKKI